ncbi:virulence RhuM family protein [Bacteroides sp. HF-5092]|uniref:virulence RhuM family protein n=1 Tax=Bacteroides TaxID=816 RepID=UPI00117866FD|nr:MULTISPECIES: RhuM family protein [Bacteroides]TRX47868.1 virulence RhuM family protein [Bacteroides sp. HF-5092]
MFKMNMEESNNGSKKLQIRNSTAEFLIFQIENKEEGIEVLYQDETLWLTQKTMSILFDVDIRTINEHLKNIYSQGEVDKNTTIRKNRIVQKEGNRNISREVFIYSLDAIISVGYRVNSVRATQFRQWCTYILRQFAIRGYVIDKKRMENWAKRIDKFLDSDDRPVLNDSGKVSTEQAKDYAETEFEKYRIIQDCLFQSDFDKFNTGDTLDFVDEIK